MSAQSQFGSQVTFVGVPGLAEAADFDGFINQHGVTQFPHLTDGLAIWQRFGVTQQRTYVLINDDGSWQRTGYGNLIGDVQGLINS